MFNAKYASDSDKYPDHIPSLQTMHTIQINLCRDSTKNECAAQKMANSSSNTKIYSIAPNKCECDTETRHSELCIQFCVCYQKKKGIEIVALLSLRISNQMHAKWFA